MLTFLKRIFQKAVYSSVDFTMKRAIKSAESSIAKSQKKIDEGGLTARQEDLHRRNIAARKSAIEQAQDARDNPPPLAGDIDIPKGPFSEKVI